MDTSLTISRFKVQEPSTALTSDLHRLTLYGTWHQAGFPILATIAFPNTFIAVEVSYPDGEPYYDWGRGIPMQRSLWDRDLL
jgi:hypothetical protein